MNRFLSFSMASILIVILLMAVYFQEKRVKSITNYIYIFIMFLVFFCIGTELLSYLIVPVYFKDNTFLLTFMFKLNLVLTELWAITVCFYVTIIALNNKSKKNIIIRFWIDFIIFLVGAVVICMTPIKYMFDETGDVLLYAYGPSTDCVIVFGILSAIIAFYQVIVRKDSTDKSPVILLISVLLCGIVLGGVETFNPAIIVLSLSMTIILFVLYATIQNPDLNMVIDLNFAREQAEKASSTKSNFLSSMTHEIKTPLNAIVGLSDDISENEEIPVELKDDVRDIVNSSKILLEIIGNILDINKIESGLMSVVEEPYSIRNEISSVIHALDVLEINNNKIEIQISDSVPKVLLGDKEHLNKILVNLISNALKFTKSGIVKIVVDAENNLDTMTSMIKISVIDNGKGIKEEDISKLFTRFQKINDNTTVEGTGLGLAISKQLIELMHGNISVQSVYGEGSTFTFVLPQKIGCAFSKNLNFEYDEKIDLKKLRILVVDDNLLNVKVAKKVFGSLGITINYCLNGQDCIDKVVSGEHYDMIFMDVLMPEMPGDIVIKKINERMKLDTPVIALTASIEAGYDRKLKALGFTDYLTKPFNKDQLRRKMYEILSGSDKEV